MGQRYKTELVKFVAPLSAVIAAALAGVVVIGGQSPAPATAAVAPAAVSAAQVASFKPFADEPTYRPPVTPTPAPQTVVYEIAPSQPMAAPSSALPVYGNVIDEQKPTTFVDRVTPLSGSGSGTGIGNGTGGNGALGTAGTSTASQGYNPDNVTLSDATITVGTATINVLSSFKLNYGGKTILTGSNGQTTPTP